jgi:hypothetical protein
VVRPLWLLPPQVPQVLRRKLHEGNRAGCLPPRHFGTRWLSRPAEHVDVDRAVIRWRVTGAEDYRGVNLMRVRDSKIIEALGYGKRP